MRRSLTDFGVDDLKYLKLGAIVHAVLAFFIAYFGVSELLTIVGAFIWFTFGEDWLRNNVDGFMYVSQTVILRVLKRDLRPK